MKKRKVPRVCLNMIVRNESHVIEECLQSIVHLVDYYVINDTGSSDDTREKIKNFFKKHNIKGEIHDHDFRTCSCHGPEYKKYQYFHFGWNRTWALEKCLGKSEYIFIMDADDVVEGNLKFPPKLVADQYYLKIRTDHNSYMRPQLIKNNARFKWRYEDGLHEFLKSDLPNQVIHHLIDDYTINSRRLGDRNRDAQKYHKDVAFLKLLMADRPDYPRYMHYYGQSLFDTGLYNESIAAYTSYIEKETFEEGKYFARLMIGKAHLRLKSTDDEIKKAFETCFEHHPEYAEPMYELCKHFNSVGKYDEAYNYGKKVVYLTAPTKKVLAVDHDVYSYKLLDELIWACTECKKYQEAIYFSRRLLKTSSCTPEQQQIVNENIKALSNMSVGTNFVDDLYASIKDNIIIGMYLAQSPLQTFYGSELAAFKLSTAMASDKTKVIIFCDQVEKIKEQDGVYFMPSALLKSDTVFNKPNVFDVMIVSRYINYFIEINSAIAKKTYFWLHDIYVHSYYNCGYLPNEARALVQNTQHLVDGYVFGSPWQRQGIIDFYGVNPDKCHVIGLGIDPDICRATLAKNLPRKKNRFVWISDWRRNLAEFMQQFMLIKAYMDDAEILIYRDLPDDLKEKYSKLEYVKLMGYQDNSKVLEGLSTSDYFCYVTEFQETYCLSAHEAQAMGCICICSDVAALSTTVGDRGILLKQNNLLEQVMKLTEEKKAEMRVRAQEWALSQSWDVKAKEWFKLMEL